MRSVPDPKIKISPQNKQICKQSDFTVSCRRQSTCSPLSFKSTFGSSYLTRPSLCVLIPLFSSFSRWRRVARAASLISCRITSFFADFNLCLHHQTKLFNAWQLHSFNYTTFSSIPSIFSASQRQCFYHHITTHHCYPTNVVLAADNAVPQRPDWQHWQNPSRWPASHFQGSSDLIKHQPSSTGRFSSGPNLIHLASCCNDLIRMIMMAYFSVQCSRKLGPLCFLSITFQNIGQF